MLVSVLPLDALNLTVPLEWNTKYFLAVIDSLVLPVKVITFLKMVSIPTSRKSPALTAAAWFSAVLGSPLTHLPSL